VVDANFCDDVGGAPITDHFLAKFYLTSHCLSFQGSLFCIRVCFIGLGAALRNAYKPRSLPFTRCMLC
jgi:hypothetical protein